MIVTEQYEHEPPRVRIETASTAVTRHVDGAGAGAPVRGSVVTEVVPPYTPAAGSARLTPDAVKYQAFPYTARHPETGVIVAVWRTADTHLTDLSAYVSMSRSDDDGASWSPPRRVHKVIGADTSPAGLVPLPGGGWGMQVLARTPAASAYYMTAGAGAEFWTLQAEVSRPPGYWYFAAGLARVADGTPGGVLIATGYGGTSDVTIENAWTLVQRSTDGGKTWVAAGEVGRYDGNTSRAYVEAQVIQSPVSRELVMLIRHQAGVGQTYEAAYSYKIMVSRSSDLGVTWTRPVVAVPGMSGMPTLCATRSGALVTDLRVPEVESAVQTTGRHIWAWSSDDGVTWRLGGEFDPSGRMAYGQFVTTSADDLLLVAGIETAANTDADITVRRFDSDESSTTTVLYDYEIPQGVPFSYRDDQSASRVLEQPPSCLYLVPVRSPEKGSRFPETLADMGDREPIEVRSELVIPGGNPHTVTRRPSGKRQGIGAVTRGDRQSGRLADCLDTAGVFFLSVPPTMWQLRGWTYADVSDVRWKPLEATTEIWGVTAALTSADRPAVDTDELHGWPAMPDTWAEMPDTWAEMPK